MTSTYPLGLEGPASWKARYHALETEVITHLRTPSSTINLSTPSNFLTTLILSRFVYDHDYSNKYLTIVYADGSMPDPFPLGVLEQIDITDEVLTPIRVGLMSNRHPELDFIVDLYANTNEELSPDLEMSMEDVISSNNAMSLLKEVKNRKDPLLLDIIHTGLEPMVVGFYRGVVQAINHRIKLGYARNLYIRPNFFFIQTEKDREEFDEPFSLPTRKKPSDVGANIIENYIRAPVWA